MRVLLILLVFVGFVFSGFSEKPENNSAEVRLAIQIYEVKKVVDASSKYNKEIAFFIDMGIESGKFRFFIYNLKTNEIIDGGLVTHGFGSEKRSSGELIFSNVSNSLCTSLGKYSVGKSYLGSYGKAYKLYGLDKTNSNAFKRNIVLHKMSSIPDQEQNGSIEKSFGCPAVNERYFERLATIIDNSNSNIIMSIYY
ncbi:murein L,D-transpeptidase catalytic domain-containing protein [Flavobacterium frigoris]|uniref:L,D-transpeptidase catalytic domain n=1 Tax=Flavobacterium frigoris (strain PS1) TaxID=1086011 RepID=H7FUR1_FLAFP|nr:murein L,D-transpeptidase catalytic domain family protein [Flavobacterium frigoris]EIA07750.1 hypothetical protein HJ01_02909 [Flavobacterium frigoris PS1]